MVLYLEDSRTFFLETKNTSYIFRIYEQGILLQLYYGKKIGHDGLAYLNRPYTGAFSPVLPGGKGCDGSMDAIPNEYPVFGLGDFRLPALSVENTDGSRLCHPAYQSHRIVDGKPLLEGLPHLSAGEADAQTLEILLTDEVLQLEVTLSYTAYHDVDVIARSVKVCNKAANNIKLTKVASACLDLPDNQFQMLQLWGGHARECMTEITPLRHGVNLIESRRGVSSHQQNPFMALLRPDTTEDFGEVYGFSLIYSGNFQISTEVDQFNTTRVELGLSPYDFSWKLESGETFVTPEALLVFSSEGLGGMSHAFHTACRRHLGKSLYRNQIRPTILNSWEAVYFNFNEEKLKNLIQSSSGLGIDIFVLDDGWFGKRNNDTCSMGDWEVNRDKLPGGLDPVIQTCKECGMQFGLWIEPEMVSENSELYHAHPDWCIHVKNRDHCRGRNQLVLDLSREDVRQYLADTISALLSQHDISYIKWDMNRHITNSGSALLPPDRQMELGHRYMLGLYHLMDQLTDRFPHVLFEGCSGGGGRFDFGILYYMPQIWTSDNSDAICRLKIQYGTSLVYPPSAMVGHVSAVPNHQTGRITPLSTRANVAMTCNYGYELDPSALTEEEREMVRQQTKQQKSIAPLVADGQFYRLVNPFDDNGCTGCTSAAWQLVSPDQTHAFAVYVQALSGFTLVQRRLRLKGLHPDTVYHVQELDADLSGEVLMNVGLPIGKMRADFLSCTFTLAARD